MIGRAGATGRSRHGAGPPAGRRRRDGALLLAPILLLALGACGGTAESETPQMDAERQAVIRFWELYRAATALRVDGQRDEAIRTYREALDIDPRHEDCLYYLGQLLAERGEAAEARAALDRLLEVNPGSFRGHVALAALLTTGPGPRDLAEAERHLRRAHEINAEETGAVVRLGEVLIARGERAEARHWLDAAIQTNPRSVEAAVLAGYLRWEAGEHAAAREFLDRALLAWRPPKPAGDVPGEGDVRPSAAPPPSARLRGPYAAPIGELMRRLESDPVPADLGVLYLPLQSVIESPLS